jgi:hypothetical protein
MDSVRALMSGLIDYAGLFPPAGLGMHEAVENYAEYRKGPDAASLGSFIIPIDRLGELESELAAGGASSSSSSRLDVSLIVKENPVAAIDRASAINASPGAYRVVAIELAQELTVEMKAISERGLSDRSAPIIYAEISPADDIERILPQLARFNARAKLRTGGTSANSFPTTAQIVRFLRACCNSGVGFKATAGLHHPIRAHYPLTYDADSPRAQMYGFLNIFLAAAFVWNGTDDVTAARIVNENVPVSFTFSNDAIGWLDLKLSVNRIAAARERFAYSFGSCSFREPVEELRNLLSTTAAV